MVCKVCGVRGREEGGRAVCGELSTTYYDAPGAELADV